MLLLTEDHSPTVYTQLNALDVANRAHVVQELIPEFDQNPFTSKLVN